jgi:hypothetical protein
METNPIKGEFKFTELLNNTFTPTQLMTVQCG